MSMLEEELKLFEEKKAQLKEEYPNGGYVIIKGSEILGVWNTRQDAIKTGVEKFGNTPFLVKNIDDTDKAINTFSRNLAFV
jgi:hypothetical protein